MSLRFLPSAFVLVIALLSTFVGRNTFFIASAQPVNAQRVNNSQNDLQVGAVTFKQLSTVKISGITRSIWENSNNVALDPNAWLFAIEPFLIPEVDSKGQLVSTIRLFDASITTGPWRLQFSLVTLPAQVRERALREIVSAKKPKLTELRPNQLLTLEMGQLAVLIPSLAKRYPKCSLGDDTISTALLTTQFWDVNGLPDDRYDVVIKCPSRQMIENVRSFISGQNILYSYTYKGRNAITNSININLGQLKRSQLYLKLFGSSKAESVYVHRDDLRLLSESVQNSIRATYVIEDPANFNTTFADNYIENYAKTISLSSKAFDEAKYQSTYNRDDLRPDVIESQTNKIFTEYKGSIKIATSGSSSFNLSVPIKAVTLGFGSSSSTSTESVKEEYRKHDIDLSWTGKKFIVKSINLQQVNRSDFENSANYVTAKTVLSPIDFFSRRTALQMSLFTSKATQGALSLYQRVEDIENALRAFVPIGSIIAWHKGLPGTKVLPSNWVECDGKLITDKTSPLFNQISPNLNGEGRFLRGAMQSGQIQEQDWKSMSVRSNPMGKFQYTHGPVFIPKVGSNPIPFYSGAWGWAPGTSESSGITFEYDSAAEIRPANMSVVWIIRIK
jgi:hypothetical protein